MTYNLHNVEIPSPPDSTITLIFYETNFVLKFRRDYSNDNGKYRQVYKQDSGQ